MKFCLIDPETRLVLSSGEASKYNIPRNALIVEPLPYKEGFAVIASEDMTSTEYVVDNRGKVIYNKLKPTDFKIVESLGDVEDGWTLTPPPTVYHTFSDELDDWELTAEAQTQQRTDAIKQSIESIDNEAGTRTVKWTRFTEEYKEREAAALAYKAANYSGDVSLYISSFADTSGMSFQQATDLILQQANSLRTLQSQIAAERMRKNELKKPDLTLKDIAALRDEIIANIKALGESYE